MKLGKILSSIRLPRTATAPFCPSEVRGTVLVPSHIPAWKKFLRFLGPGLLVSVGYMDPGNWATDIEAGSRYGYGLLNVVVACSLAAILLQYLSLKLGLATGMDLARQSREQFRPKTNFALWILAELAIIACDLAEVLGSALAFKLLFGCSLLWGVAITALDTVIILSLKGRGFRQIEAIVLGLILTIGICYGIELFLAQPDWGLVAGGLIPSRETFQDSHAWYLAIGILGATVMPHNLYLHSSVVQTRFAGGKDEEVAEAIRYSTWDTVVSLSLALFVNASILILAASAFHFHGHQGVADIQDAHELLSPVLGSVLASALFAIALLASGQSSTFTGTIAGQILMEGYMNWKIPCWQRRLITRALALIPAFFGVLWLGENSVGRLLVLSQVCLSLQLPFAIFPLIKFTSNPKMMRGFANGPLLKTVAWILFLAISSANIWMVYQVFS